MEINKLKSKIIRASRMPPMAKEHAKIIIRPRGGLNIAKTGPTVIGKAIVEAAGLTPTQISSGIICPNIQRNIMVASTPNRDSASKYTRIRTPHRELLFQNQDQIPLQGSLRIPAPRQSSPVQVLLEVLLQGSPTQVSPDLGRPSSRNAEKGNAGLTARA
ncbi:hypothetical protein HPB49_019208 [Dermacentor silvarum]|uniref:Uncharacterized protein n=1 Tax=Dermacentor silvarum TaxID=543639 RepID=A0ACB8CGZ1_DERSI|nr:hypothetical protein HPB49_019208 [Dermacentor silvarum]